MFEIKYGSEGEIVIRGRFDASQAEKAGGFLADVDGDRVVDLRELDYISSAGLATLLQTQKRLMGSGAGLRLVNVSSHINNIFQYTGFHQIFRIETGSDD